MKNKLLFIALIALLSGCVGQRGAMKYYLKHDDQLAELAAAKFPVKERTVQGPTVIVRDSIFTAGPTIPCPEVTNPATGEKTTPKVKCPDTKTVTNNVTVHDTTYREDTAKLVALKNSTDKSFADLQGKFQAALTSKSELQGNLDSAKTDLAKVRKALATNKWVGLSALIVILGMGFIIIKK